MALLPPGPVPGEREVSMGVWTAAKELYHWQGHSAHLPRGKAVSPPGDGKEQQDCCLGSLLCPWDSLSHSCTGHWSHHCARAVLGQCQVQRAGAEQHSISVTSHWRHRHHPKGCPQGLWGMEWHISAFSSEPCSWRSPPFLSGQDKVSPGCWHVGATHTFHPALPAYLSLSPCHPGSVLSWHCTTAPLHL